MIKNYRVVQIDMPVENEKYCHSVEGVLTSNSLVNPVVFKFTTQVTDQTPLLYSLIEPNPSEIPSVPAPEVKALWSGTSPPVQRQISIALGTKRASNTPSGLYQWAMPTVNIEPTNE